MEEKIALSIRCSSFQIVGNGDSPSFDKIVFSIDVSLSADRSYQVQRSYVDFVDFDRRIRNQIDLNLPFDRKNIDVVERGMKSGLYNYPKLKNRDISLVPYSIPEPIPSVGISPGSKAKIEKNSWIQTVIGGIVKSIPIVAKSRDTINHDWIRSKENNFSSTVSDLDLYLQKVLSYHEIVQSELFSLFLDPDSIPMANMIEGKNNAMGKTESVSVHELLLIDAINEKTEIRGFETKMFAVKEGQVIVWKFKIIGFNIGFSVRLNGELRMSYTQCNAHQSFQYGSMQSSVDGFCELIWDNPYSICKYPKSVNCSSDSYLNS